MSDLGEMTLNEFIDNWDSDESEIEQSDKPPLQTKGKMEAKKNVAKRKKEATDVSCETASGVDKTVSHQTQLDQLKEKDPEFYKFLQEEDKSLLQFDEGDFGLDESSDEDSDSGIHRIPVELEEASDSDIESYNEDDQYETEDGGDKVKKDSSQLVTVQMIEEWKTKLIQDKSSVPGLKELMKSFRAAVLRFTESEDSKEKSKKKTKYKVLSSEIFNSIVGLCLQQVIPSLAKILNISQKQSSNQVKPQKSKSWDKVREIVQYYLGDVIMLNQLLLEPTVLCASLRHTLLLVPYYLCFPKVTKQLMKFLIKTWSGFDDESVRVLSFLCINRILKLDSDKYLENALKQCYLAYVSNCKFTTPSSLPFVNFLQQTLCELFAIKPHASSPIAFLYIRQLAIHLRKAMTVPKKENYQAVYNWQFIHCIGLWCRMVGNLSSDDDIKPLLYPLVQVSLGTIDLLPTTRYFPLRYRVIKYLILLMDRANVYIPLLPYITKPTRLAEFSKKSGAVMEPLNFATMLRLSNSQLKGSSYRSTTIDEMYDVLMEYLNTQAHTISFPEMVVPTLISLKKYAKGCKVAIYSKPIYQLLSKIEENSMFIVDRRSKVTFGVADIKSVDNWERSLRTEGVPFHKHYNNYKKSRQAEKRHAAAGIDVNVEERLPQIDRKKFIELAKAKDREELSELFAGGEDFDFGNEVDDTINNKEAQNANASKKKVRSKKRKNAESAQESEAVVNKEDTINVAASQPKAAKMKKIEDEEPDLVEDFHFSSDED